MTNDLNWQQQEEMARRWCSKRHNIKLTNDRVIFWNQNKIYEFEFDITSRPKRKEFENINSKIRQYEKEQSKKIDRHNPLFAELVKMYCRTPNEPDHREVIGMVKSGRHANGNRTYESTLGDCFLLTRAKADKKYMILTDKKMHEYFLNRCRPIMQEIELVYLDPDEHGYLLDEPVS